MKLQYTVSEQDNFFNIKELIKCKFNISDRLLTKLKKNNYIFLNKLPCNIKEQVTVNDIIEIDLGYSEDNSNIVPSQMNLNILYEDEYILIVNKPYNMPVHPSMAHFTDSLSNGVKYYFDSINLHKKIRPVNRLDRDTSGIVIFAKNEYIQECLIKQMANKTFIKEYIAICKGYSEKKEGTIIAPIARKKGSIIERCIDSTGDTAITHFYITKSSNSHSIVNLKLETGRTHQIRVHLAHIGLPIIGDTLYGVPSSLIDRQALHSSKICFIHPISNEQLEINAPLYDDMKKIINEL